MLLDERPGAFRTAQLHDHEIRRPGSNLYSCDVRIQAPARPRDWKGEFMRRTIITVSLSVLLLAGLAGWIIGNLAGGSADPTTGVSTTVDAPAPPLTATIDPVQSPRMAAPASPETIPPRG